MRRRYHWTRDELGRFAISRQPVAGDAFDRAQEEIYGDRPEPSGRVSADAGAGLHSGHPHLEPTMSDIIRAQFYGGSASDWQRERERYEE
jgi:hypothetical protein